jgi:2-polyprenyl-6-methoxyphenol hydroxylase-like FAD-dependent oxidoreductase
VYERAPEIREIGAGVGLWTAALAVFDRLGIGDGVRALGRTWQEGGIRWSDGRYLVRYTADDFARRLGELTIGVHRGELQQLLLASLPSGVVRTDAACTDVVQRATGAAVRFADGSEASGRAVIGADGIRSVIRARLFGDRPLHDCRTIGWRGTAAVDVPGAADFTGETWGSAARFGVLPIAGRVTWYAAAGVPRRRPAPVESKDDLRAYFGSWHEPIGALIDATDPDHIWSDHLYDRRPLRRWTKGRVTLLGDAAHPMTPDLGQGACQAVLDAWAVARALARHTDVEAAFADYERRRRHRAWMVSMVARGATSGARLSVGRLASARARLVGAVPASVALRQLEFVARA